MTGLSAHRQKDAAPTGGWVTLGILTRWVRNPTRKVRSGTRASVHPTYIVRDAVTEGGSTGVGSTSSRHPFIHVECLWEHKTSNSSLSWR